MVAPLLLIPILTILTPIILASGYFTAKKGFKRSFDYGYEKISEWLSSHSFVIKCSVEDKPKATSSDCFAVFANALSITWGDHPEYWKLHSQDTSDYGKITVAQLKNVCWLEVHGRLETSVLTQGVTYQVTYLIMLDKTSSGWDVPVNLRLTLPNGTNKEHKQDLSKKPKGEWFRIPVGEFKASSKNMGSGEIEFSLFECKNLHWKKGLVIIGATIEPKPPTYHRYTYSNDNRMMLR